MGEFSDQVLALFRRASAPEQGGIISGDNPATYNANDPFRLWVIQLIIIMAMCQALSMIFARIRQPRVIAEVIGGVILGPTVMGRIPGFKNAIFPDGPAMAGLTLTSTIGLVLFLFLVGLEIDTRLLRRNVVTSASVSIVGLLVPLGLGAALGVAIYNHYVTPSQDINFGHFLLFIAVAVGITAFPVLCRILTELKLLDTEVGLITLSAGIGNDVVGWILLALTVALVNASSGLTALWVLLACAAYTIFLLYPARWAYRWLAKRSGSLEQGSPTPLLMMVTLVIVFVSAFFTDVIGVHPIFGGFLAGLIIPHDNGFAISIVEKLEDLVTITLLPIYFTLSGLKTDLGLLNTGTDWGYIVLICVVAFTSKFFSCSIAAALNGFRWREAGAIGSLMSCKGLVELIVLNIGFQAKILSQKTFSMFVVHALILTFMTTPLVLFFYPAKYRLHQNAAKIKADGEHDTKEKASSDTHKTKFAIVLDKIEALPAAMTITQLLQSPSSALYPTSQRSSLDEKALMKEMSNASRPPLPIKVEALRLMELTNRTSAVLRSQQADALIYNDPVVSIFRTFGRMHNLKVSANLSVVNFDEFPETISKHVLDTESQMVVIPWPRGMTSVLDEKSAEPTGVRNPFDGIFHRTTSQDQTSSIVYSDYIRKVFRSAPGDIALFVERGTNSMPDGVGQTQLFLAFFGGPDDRLALSFLVQLCEGSNVTATVVRMIKTESVSSPKEDVKQGHGSHHQTMAAADTVYGQPNTELRLSSDTADNLIWDRYTRTPASPALSRISFHAESSPTPLRRVTELVKNETASWTTTTTTDSNSNPTAKNLIVLAGRSRRLAVESLSHELDALVSESGANEVSTSVPKTLGDIGAALAATSAGASLLILQAAPVET